jgi:hypothetical protein
MSDFYFNGDPMMKEKIRQDELLTEAPETRRSSSAVEEQTTAYMDDRQI